MGSPKSLTAEQEQRSNALTTDTPESSRVMRVGRKGSLRVDLPMRFNDIVLVTLAPIATSH
jgi:xylan 1,4-beta-xylosidase